MNPTDDMAIAAIEAITPRGSTEVAVPSSMSATPPMPTKAPNSRRIPGRSRRIAHAATAIATEEVAMIVDAMLVGSSCAAA